MRSSSFHSIDDKLAAHKKPSPTKPLRDLKWTDFCALVLYFRREYNDGTFYHTEVVDMDDGRKTLVAHVTNLTTKHGISFSFFDNCLVVNALLDGEVAPDHFQFTYFKQYSKSDGTYEEVWNDLMDLFRTQVNKGVRPKPSSHTASSFSDSSDGSNRYALLQSLHARIDNLERLSSRVLG